MHKIVPLVFTLEAQADADGVIEFDVPVGMTILGVSLCVEEYSGSGTRLPSAAQRHPFTSPQAQTWRSISTLTLTQPTSPSFCT